MLKKITINKTNILKVYCFRPPRSSNFNKKEVARLEALILKYRDILFSKKIDQNTLKQKESVWLSIEEEFNANAEGRRTARQLRNKFENIKKALKRVC